MKSYSAIDWFMQKYLPKWSQERWITVLFCIPVILFRAWDIREGSYLAFAFYAVCWSASFWIGVKFLIWVFKRQAEENSQLLRGFAYGISTLWVYISMGQAIG